MTDKILIGEVCRQANCTPRTVRHYENEALINPVAKTAGGHKLYSKETISIIQTAQLLKRLGYSLSDIREIIVLTKSRNTKNQHLTIKLRKMLSETMIKVDLELELLSLSRKKISDLIEKTQKCDGCKSPDCGNCGKLGDLRTLGLFES